jgi:peptide/nickel transport system permease protein
MTASRRDPLVALAAVAFTMVVLFAVVGLAWTRLDPDQLFTADPLSRPSWSHPFGADDLGRDIFSRALRGAAGSLLAPFAVVVGATTFGAVIGTLAAWYGGAVDWILARAIDVIFAIPGLVLAVLAVAMFGKGLTAPVLALAIAYVPISARLVRTTVQVELAKPYIEALRVQGVGAPAFWFRHLLPALLPTILAQGTVAFGYAMVDLAAISFLGLGEQPPAADWGVLVASGQASILGGHPEQSLFPSLLILATVLSVNLLGARATMWAEGRDR